MPSDSVSWDYAYGEDDKANIRLAWYRDLPGYIKYEKKWIRWVKNHDSPSEPTFSLTWQKGLLFLGQLAAKDYENASETLAGGEVRVRNNFSSKKIRFFRSRILLEPSLATG